MSKLHLLLPLLLLFACSAQKNIQKIEFARTGEVKCIKYDRDVIHLTSTARASSLGEATVYAERNAIENLLFKGIPNSNQEHALVANEYESLRGHAGFYEQFISNRDYEKFIMESVIASKVEEKGHALVSQNIQVDMEAMRRHLEQNKIIRKFGL